MNSFQRLAIKVEVKARGALSGDPELKTLKLNTKRNRSKISVKEALKRLSASEDAFMMKDDKSADPLEMEYSLPTDKVITYSNIVSLVSFSPEDIPCSYINQETITEEELFLLQEASEMTNERRIMKEKIKEADQHEADALSLDFAKIYANIDKDFDSGVLHSIDSEETFEETTQSPTGSTALRPKVLLFDSVPTVSYVVAKNDEKLSSSHFLAGSETSLSPSQSGQLETKISESKDQKKEKMKWWVKRNSSKASLINSLESDPVFVNSVEEKKATEFNGKRHGSMKLLQKRSSKASETVRPMPADKVEEKQSSPVICDADDFDTLNAAPKT